MTPHANQLDEFRCMPMETEWLHGLHLANEGRLTRAALVLMGKPTATIVLGGPTPRLPWVLTDHTGTIQTHQHFDLPLVRAIDVDSQKYCKISHIVQKAIFKSAERLMRSAERHLDVQFRAT